VEDLAYAHVAQIAGDREILEVAVAAEELQCLVADMKPGIGRQALGHRAMHGRLRVAAIEARSTPPYHQPRRLELARHVGKPELERLEIGERPAELAAFEQVVARRLEASAGPAKRAGRYVEAAAVEPLHGDFGAVAFL